MYGVEDFEGVDLCVVMVKVGDGVFVDGFVGL